MESLKNKRTTVAGLGHFGGGVAVARWLVEQGARVLVTDKAPAEKLQDSLHQLAGLPIHFVLGEHRREDFTNCDLLVVSPAIPPQSKFIEAAIAASVPITTEIALFAQRCPAPVIGVTGTKGKSTTATLLAKMLATHYTTHFGGNIGTSLLAELPSIRDDQRVVLELSSFMLHWLGKSQWAPHVALYTMVGQDHLDWHGDVSAYHDAKANLSRFQSSSDFCCLPKDDTNAEQLAAHSPAYKIRYPAMPRRFELSIPGEHNQQNAQGAFAAASTQGIFFWEAQNAVRDFTGLPHRLQLVHESRGVKFYDDSIATIPEAAAVANAAFDHGRVIQIVGGSDKGLEVNEMCRILRERCKAILCIGSTAETLAKCINHEDGLGQVLIAGTLDVAIEKAKSLASEGDVVLLSPGYASYDQFENFAHRGDEFSRLARQFNPA